MEIVVIKIPLTNAFRYIYKEGIVSGILICITFREAKNVLLYEIVIIIIMSWREKNLFQRRFSER